LLFGRLSNLMLDFHFPLAPPNGGGVASLPIASGSLRTIVQARAFAAQEDGPCCAQKVGNSINKNLLLLTRMLIAAGYGKAADQALSLGHNHRRIPVVSNDFPSADGTGSSTRRKKT
jgi:hypothetical protein